MPEAEKNNLTITLSGRQQFVDARAFFESLRDTLDVLFAIDQTVSHLDDGSLEWQIAHAATNSPVSVTLHGATKVAADFGDIVLSAMIDGIEVLEREAEMPQFFNLQAIKALKSLTDHYSNGVSKITLATRERRISPSNRVREHATALCDPEIYVEQTWVRGEHVEFGAIEGTVETLIAHNQLSFNLYDSLNKTRVRCEFADELDDSVRAAWRQRATVTGHVHYDSDGNPKKIVVESIRIQPDAKSLPDFKSSGINITGGMESSEYVRGLREDE